MLDLLLFGVFYISWILFRNDELERVEKRLGHELEHVIALIEDRNNEIEKKDELIFVLFEQVDQLKDNIEILQHVSLIYNTITRVNIAVTLNHTLT